MSINGSTHIQRMKKGTVLVILFSFTLQLFIGCGGSYPAPGVEGKKYSYVYQLTDPVISPKMEFKDSQVSITFDIDDAAISYTVLNLVNKPLILESGSAMIGIDSVYVPVRNRVSLYSDSVKGFAPLLLPGRGYVEDLIIPRDNIFWTEDGWVERDLFSTLDSGTVSGRKNITKNIGKKLELLLPIKVGGYRMDYLFKFKVTAIKVVQPDKPAAAKVRPPAPSLFSGNIDPWITIGVAAGIALVSGAIILSEKKPVGPLN